MEVVTLNFLKQLEELALFSRVGNKEDLSKSREIHAVSTWAEALEFVKEELYDDVSGEAANELYELISEKSPASLDEWNSKVEAIKTLTEPLIKNKLTQLKKSGAVPEGFSEGPIKWDFLHICMQLEYQHISETEYYKALMKWYLGGHFPCGWKGELADNMHDTFANGKLAVY